MRFLLDTNVLSEGAKPEPDRGLAGWLEGRSTLDLCVSVLTLGEIRKGILLMPEGRRRDRLHDWLRGDLVRRFQGRILSIDDAVALAWGGLSAEGPATGRRLPVIDGLLLATAAVHDLVFVTRNERDCAGRGVPVLNPWQV